MMRSRRSAFARRRTNPGLTARLRSPFGRASSGSGLRPDQSSS